MSLVSLLVVLLLLAVILYVIQIMPLDEQIKRIIQLVVGVFVLVWIITSFFGYGPELRFK